MFLDYGYRSKCCSAPIRFGIKVNKKTGIRKKIIICTKCRTRDVDIVPSNQSRSQTEKENPFADDFTR